MSVKVETNNSVATQPISLKERAAQNWNNRKVEVVGSGLTTGVLAGGVAAATAFGGPLGAIIGLAVATFLALGLFLKSIFSQSKEMIVPEKKIQVPVTIEKAPVVATPAKPAVQTATQAEAPVAQTQTAKEQGIGGKVLSYVKAHPYKTALGTAAILGAGIGAYAAYGTYTTGAAATAGFCAAPQTLLPQPAATECPAFTRPVWPVCPLNDKAANTTASHNVKSFLSEAPPTLREQLASFGSTVAEGIKSFGSKTSEDAAHLNRELGITNAYHTANTGIKYAASAVRDAAAPYAKTAAEFLGKKGETLTTAFAGTNLNKDFVQPALSAYQQAAQGNGTTAAIINTAGKVKTATGSVTSSVVDFCADQPVACAAPLLSKHVRLNTRMGIGYSVNKVRTLTALAFAPLLFVKNFVKNLVV